LVVAFLRKSLPLKFINFNAKGKKDLDDVKRLIVSKENKKQGFLSIQLLKMLDMASSQLISIDRESTVPPMSKMFSVLCNTFVALDIFTEAVTKRREGVQFSSISSKQLEVVGCPMIVVAEYAVLQNTVFCGVSPPSGGNLVRFFPWELWSGMKHRRITTVQLIVDGDTECLQLGDIVVPRCQFENYIQQAKKVVKLAYDCKLL
jgi:hypothetical protein